MRFARLRAEDGLIRGIVGLAVILVVIAVVVLDSISMFSASQKVDSDAHSAANAARFAPNVFVVSTSAPASRYSS